MFVSEADTPADAPLIDAEILLRQLDQLRYKALLWIANLMIART
jgi:hypothetical protein